MLLVPVLVLPLQLSPRRPLSTTTTTATSTSMHLLVLGIMLRLLSTTAATTAAVAVAAGTMIDSRTYQAEEFLVILAFRPTVSGCSERGRCIRFSHCLHQWKVPPLFCAQQAPVAEFARDDPKNGGVLDAWRRDREILGPSPVCGASPRRVLCRSITIYGLRRKPVVKPAAPSHCAFPWACQVSEA